MTFRVAIVEDEAPARERLEDAVRRFDPSIRIVARLASVAETTAWLDTNPEPDLFLCDIRLSDGLSLRVFERHPVQCPVIFCTAYDEYVLEALAVSGIDYLLKPIEQARVDQALTKYRALRAHFAGKLGTLAEQLAGATGPRRRIVVRKGHDHVVVPVEDIAYFATEHRLVLMVTREGAQHVVDHTLGELVTLLDGERFFRTGRSHIVAHDAVRSFQGAGKGRLTVCVEPRGAEVTVSPERAAAFRAWIAR